MRLLPWATKWTRTPLTAGPFQEGVLQVESLHRSMEQCLLKGIQGQVGTALQIRSCNTMHLYTQRTLPALRLTAMTPN